jgi:hypothetical protein
LAHLKDLPSFKYDVEYAVRRLAMTPELSGPHQRRRPVLRRFPDAAAEPIGGLYSVGLDGVDDGGTRQWDEKNPSTGGDILFVRPSDFPLRGRSP